MTERNFVDKNGNSWVWEETPETIEALKKLHSGDYQGPLYSQHPDLKKPNEYKTTDS